MKDTFTVKYRCYYYSFLRHKISFFNLTLIKKETWENGELVDEMMVAHEIGLHEGVKGEKEYLGPGTKYNQRWVFNLESGRKVSDHLVISLLYDTSSYSIDEIAREESAQLIFGQFSTYSSVENENSQGLISGEFIGIKLDAMGDPVVKESHLLLVRRHLMLNRNNHRVRSRGEIKDPKKVAKQLTRGINLHYIRHIVGKYRILTPIQNGLFIQSRLDINEDYSSFLYTDYSPEEEIYPSLQVSLLRSSNYDTVNKPMPSKLSFTFHQEQGIHVVGHAIIDIPEKKIDKEKYTFIGSYCSAGLRGRIDKEKDGKFNVKLGPRAGYFLAIHCPEGSEHFQRGLISEQELKRLGQTELEASKLYNMYINKRYLFPI